MTAALIAALIAVAGSIGTASIALTGVIVTIRQKERSDRRTEWWRRMTWAIEQTASSDEYTAQIGWRLLVALVQSDLATDTEKEAVLMLAQAILQADTEADQEGEA